MSRRICGVKESAEPKQRTRTNRSLLGIRRFYIFDDRSAPALDNAIYPIPRKAMTFRYITPELRQSSPQLHYYDNCSRLHGHKHRWMAFMDTDEYLEIVDRPGLSLAEFLVDYEAYGALGVNW